MRDLLNAISGFILRWTLPLTVFVLPLIFLPLTGDIFQVKQVALVVIASLALIAFAVQTVIRQRIIVSVTPATVPALVLGLVYVVSALVQSSSRTLALEGEVTTVITLIVIFLVTTFTLSAKGHLRFTLKAWFASVALLSLWVIASSIGLISWLDSALLNQTGFSPVGGALPYLILALPTLPVMAYLAFKVERLRSKLLLFPLTILVAVAVFISLYSLLPGQPGEYGALPFKAGGEIALAVLGRTRTSLLGTGPESFAATFSQARPVWLNATSLWNLRFTFSSNFVLQLLTTVGLLGTGAWLFFLGRTFVTHLKQQKLHNPLSTALRLLFLGVILSWLLVPLPPILLLTSAFVALTLLAIDLKSTGVTRDLRISLFAARVIDAPKKELWDQTARPAPHEMLTWMFLAVVILLVAFCLVFVGRAYAGQMYLLRSLQAAGSDGQTAYDYQAKAISLDPQNPVLHLQASGLEFGLAQSLSNKENLSDEDKKIISRLIQQSINEAKIATNLDKLNTIVWQNLALIYRQVLNSNAEANQWAVSSMSQAIGLDPTNALLRIQLGEVYYLLGNYNEAANLFTQAIQLKSDLANAHYGLAVTFGQVKDYIKSLSELKLVLNLLPADSKEYNQIKDQIAQTEPLANKQQAELQAAQEEQNQQGQQPTSTPTPSPTLPPAATQNIIPSPTPTFSYPEPTPTAQPTPFIYTPMPSPITQPSPTPTP